MAEAETKMPTTIKAMTVEELEQAGVWVHLQLTVNTPWGHDSVLEFTPDDLLNRAQDPEAFAAGVYNVTKPQYQEWMATEGTPLCGAMTKKGEPCKVALGPVQTPIDNWMRLHRAGTCYGHSHKARSQAADG